MSKTNCINCGAAKDTSEIKCPFCGTTYLDLTAIDFSSHEPVVCEFVLPSFNGTTKCCEGDMARKDKAIMRMLAIPNLESLTMESNHVDVYGSCGQRVATISTGADINIGVSFTPVYRRDRSLFDVTVVPGKED